MITMRTTLTLDDDLALLLKQKAAETQRPFKEVVNLAIRRGLQDSSIPPGEKEEVVTIPFAAGLRTGIDPDKMNQLADALELAAFVEANRRQAGQ